MFFSADKQTMVSSFLEVAVGHTVATAHQFLQASKWRLEDAMQLFYEENTGHAATPSSYIPASTCSTLSDVHNLSYSHLPLEMRGAGCSSVEMGVPACSGTTSDQFVTRRRRQTRAEINADAAGLTQTRPTELVTVRHRRSRCEMPDVASSSVVGHVVVVPASTPRRKRTRLELASQGCTPTTSKPAVVPKALGFAH